MSKILLVVMILSMTSGCKTWNHKSHELIRYNHFDNHKFRMKTIDTNQLNYNLVRGIFNKVAFNDSAKCILMKISSTNIVWEEYGLYDYKSRRYFYCSIRENNLYSFREGITEESRRIYDRMSKFISNPELASDYIYAKNNLQDGGIFELSSITVNNNKIIVHSYHW